LRQAARAFGEVERVGRSDEQREGRKGSEDATRSFFWVQHGAQHIDFRGAR